jgi:hypothetical protein
VTLFRWQSMSLFVDDMMTLFVADGDDDYNDDG